MKTKYAAALAATVIGLGLIALSGSEPEHFIGWEIEYTQAQPCNPSCTPPSCVWTLTYSKWCTNVNPPDCSTIQTPNPQQVSSICEGDGNSCECATAGW